MKTIILLYGPPGVGKLTVSRELEKKLKFKLFHVHLLADLVNSVYDFGTKEFANTFVYLWLYLFNKALRSDIKGLIVTLIYGVQTLEGKKDDQFFKSIIKMAGKAGARIFLIKLECSECELIKRLKSNDRKQFKKLTDPVILKKLRKEYNIDQKIPFAVSLEIDTTNLSPQKTTEVIIKNCI